MTTRHLPEVLVDGAEDSTPLKRPSSQHRCHVVGLDSSTLHHPPEAGEDDVPGELEIVRAGPPASVGFVVRIDEVPEVASSPQTENDLRRSRDLLDRVDGRSDIVFESVADMLPGLALEQAFNAARRGVGYGVSVDYSNQPWRR